MPLRATIGGVWLIVAVLWSGPARAVPASRISLVWTNEDASCIDASTLEASVERTLGRPVFHGDAPIGATIVGSARASVSGGYSAHVSLLAIDGTTLSERSLTTEGACQRLDESVAVVVSIMVDDVDQHAGALFVPASPPRPPTVFPTPQSTRSPGPSWIAAAALGLGAGVSRGLLPTTTAFAALRGEIEPTAFLPITLSVRVQAPSDARVGGAGGEFDAWTGELSLCPTAKEGRALRLGVCVGAGAGAISGSAVGLLGGHSADVPVLFAFVAPSAAIRIAGQFWLRAEAGLPVQFLRDRWGFLDGSGNYVEVYRPGIVAPFATILAELRSGP